MDDEFNDVSLSTEYIEEDNENEADIENEEEFENGEVNENPNEVNTVNKKVDVPSVGMMFDSYDELFAYYCAYGTQEGFAVMKLTQKKRCGLLRYVTLACSRSGESKIKAKKSIKPQPTTKTNCEARLNAVLCNNEKWRVNKVVIDHNHTKSPSNSRFFARNRIIGTRAKRKLEVNDLVGIRLHKSFNSLVVEAGGPENVPFLEKDVRNYIEEVRRLRLGEGDAVAIQKYFSKMQEINSSFFYRMDLDDEGRLKNVFWADERSRAACEEFGDVITFDTTYLTNRYEMPFAPFVGVNHHRQSTLLGCGLISSEDTETFTWLFQAWLACMHGNAPSGIITDQDQAMKNAIEIVFPNSRHRWCLWHIMKKLPEKLKGYKSYESITSVMQNIVYGSLTRIEFEERWNGMVEEFNLKSNGWLLGLYNERYRWVPSFVKDMFWAGMSTTQRSESMNAFFDSYVNSKTTIKQFVEQYENSLRNKVEKEKLEDSKFCNSCIRCISPYAMEKQIQELYTNSKFQEFQDEIRGLMCCQVTSSLKHGSIWEYEVKEDVDVGGRTRRANFKVWVNKIECEDEVEVKCNCRLFEFRGILCRHALSCLILKEILRIPNKYILRRWRKDIKRCHTKARVSYDDWKDKPEGRRFEKMCAAFHEVAEMATESDDKYDIVIDWTMRLKETLEKNDEIRVSSQTTPLSISERRIGNDISGRSNESPNILTPFTVRSKGRPPFKRKQSTMEKIIKRKVKSKKKYALMVKNNQNGTQEGRIPSKMADVIGTQESNDVRTCGGMNFHINPYEAGKLPPQGVNYDFHPQQFMRGMMPPQSVAYGYQHQFNPGIMLGPSTMPPQLWRPSSFTQLMQQGNIPLDCEREITSSTWNVKEKSNTRLE